MRSLAWICVQAWPAFAFAIPSNEHNPVGRFEFRRRVHPARVLSPVAVQPTREVCAGPVRDRDRGPQCRALPRCIPVPAENASDTEFTSDGHFVFLTGASHASSRELTYVN